eukprot:7562516-Pyramimonas_sp.AAC.1
MSTSMSSKSSWSTAVGCPLGVARLHSLNQSRSRLRAMRARLSPPPKWACETSRMELTMRAAASSPSGA